jgi:hypothetical protein
MYIKREKKTKYATPADPHKRSKENRKDRRALSEI